LNQAHDLEPVGIAGLGQELLGLGPIALGVAPEPRQLLHQQPRFLVEQRQDDEHDGYGNGHGEQQHQHDGQGARHPVAREPLDERIEDVREDRGEEKRREDRRQQPDEESRRQRDRDPGPELRRSECWHVE